MEIINKSDSAMLEEYEEFVKKNGYYMQSVKWTKIKSNWDWEVVISRGEDGSIRGGCMVLIRTIPIVKKSFMYAPRGPLCYKNEEIFLDILEGIKLLAKKHKAYRFTCDPMGTEEEYSAMMKAAGFGHDPKATPITMVQPRENYMVRDINGSTPDEVMARFKSDWRNRIRKAEKRGVYCKMCGTEALDDFYPMMIETGTRDGITIRSKSYFERFINAFTPDECRLFVCYVNEDGKEIPISGAVTVRYAEHTTYVYGASANHHRSLYPNYLMQWTMIQWALESDCNIYDLGGIPYYDDETQPAYGLYKFKKGWGGEVVIFAGEYYYTFGGFVSKLVNVAHNLYNKRREFNHRRLQKKKLKAQNSKR